MATRSVASASVAHEQPRLERAAAALRGERAERERHVARADGAEGNRRGGALARPRPIQPVPTWDCGLATSAAPIARRPAASAVSSGRGFIVADATPALPPKAPLAGRLASDAVQSYEEACAAASLGGARALQHRAGRVRQAPAREAGDGVGALRRRAARADVGRAAGRSRTRRRGCCGTPGVARGDRVAVVLPPTPETAAVFFGTWKLGAILLSMSVLYGDEGIRHRLRRLGAGGAGDGRGERGALRGCGRAGARARRAADGSLRRRADGSDLDRHGGRRSRAALLHVRHDRAREGDRARAPVPARARGVRLLPRGAGRRALPRDGRVGVGGGDRAAARAVAARRGAVRLPARGRVRPARAADVPVAQRGDERLHDADGDALDDGDRGCGVAVPVLVPPGVQRRRAAEPGGDPLVPRAVRRDGARLLRADGVVSARGELPVHGGARGLDGAADAGLGGRGARRGRAAGRRRRARRDLPAGALEPALPAGLLAQRGGRARDVRRRVVPHEGRRVDGSRTATTGTRAAPTT